MTSLVAIFSTLVGFALSAVPVESSATWARNATPLPSCEDSAGPGARRLESPDGAIAIDVECDPGTELLSLRVTAGRHTQTLRLRARSSELLWAPDSRAFLVNGGESAYAGFFSDVYKVVGGAVQRRGIDRPVQRAMVRQFPPCKAANAAPACRAIEANPEFNLSGIAWTADAKSVIVVAEVPCSSTYGGIMCQLRGYEVQVETGKILRQMSPRELKRGWQPDIGWDLRIPDPPIYKATRPRLNPSVQPPDTRRWPRVQPVSAKFPIDLRAEKVVVDLPIFTSDRAVLYHFACRGVNESYLDTLPDNWVGPLMCTLAEGDQPSEDSLLSEDDSAAWFSRGRFTRDALVGECGRYPEFGTRRSFRLRGFRLDLEAQDVETVREGTAQSFVLAVSIVQDPAAASPRAERPGFLDPRGAGRSCHLAVPGREPLMCRDQRGSWHVCKQ